MSAFPELDEYFTKVDEFVDTAIGVVGHVTDKFEKLTLRKNELERQLSIAKRTAEQVLEISQKVEAVTDSSNVPKRLDLLRYLTTIIEKDPNALDITELTAIKAYLDAIDPPDKTDERWKSILARYGEFRSRYFTLIGGIGRIYLKLYDPDGTNEDFLRTDETTKKIVLGSLVQDKGKDKTPQKYGDEKSFSNDFTEILKPGITAEKFGEKLLSENLKELGSPGKTAVVLAYGHTGSGKTFSMNQLYSYLQTHANIKGIRAFQFYDDTMREAEPLKYYTLSETADKPTAMNSFKSNNPMTICEKVIPLNDPIDKYKMDELNKSSFTKTASIPGPNWEKSNLQIYAVCHESTPQMKSLSYLKIWYNDLFGYQEGMQVFNFLHNVKFVKDEEFNRFNTTRIYDLLAFTSVQKMIIMGDNLRTNNLASVPYLKKTNKKEVPEDLRLGEENYNNYKCFDHEEYKYPFYFNKEDAKLKESYRENETQIPFTPIKSIDLVTTMEKISAARFTRSMIANNESSRSQLVVEILMDNGSTLIMLDLAGNENTKGSSRVNQIAFFEAHYINYTLAEIQRVTLEIMNPKKKLVPAMDPFGQYLNSVRQKQPSMTFLVCAHGKYKVDTNIKSPNRTAQFLKASVTHQAIRDTLTFISNIYEQEKLDAAEALAKAAKPAPVKLGPAKPDGGKRTKIRRRTHRRKTRNRRR